MRAPFQPGGDGGVLDTVKRIDQDEGVLVYRVAVIRVADDKRIDPVELRNQ
jgi:hypothetical protein